MGKDTTKEHSPILTKDLSRETLYNLFVKHSVESIAIDDLKKGEDNGKGYGNSSKQKDIRYKTEKLLFLNFLMDSDLENQIEKRKNAKYDYMIGLLFFVTSNPNFNYNFGYFKENIVSFDKTLEEWCTFLNSVVSDINTVGEISFAHNVIIQCGGILRLEIVLDSIIEVSINMERFSESFVRCGSKYNFDVIVKEGEKLIPIASGESNGSGEQSGLHRQISHLNDTYERLYRRSEALILFNHGH